jgi:hypothetical protein
MMGFNLQQLKIIEQSLIDAYVGHKFDDCQILEEMIYDIHIAIQNLEIQLRIEQYDAMNPIEAAKVVV